MSLPLINVIWIGPRMGLVHAACLRSFLRTGHDVVLHAYGPVENTPEGVRLSDAGKLLPFEAVQRHRRTGSYAIAADLLRYEIQAHELGLYVDCDVYCYRPLPATDGIVVGYEEQRTINNAVLQLPRGSLLDAMRGVGRRGWVPPWGNPAKRLLRRLQAPFRTIYDLPWGYSGPTALTWYMQEMGMTHLARPFDIFYPVPWNRAWIWNERGLSLSDIVTSRTHYVHLYLAQSQGEEILADSILSEIVAG